MRITLDLANPVELEALAAEARQSASAERRALGIALQAGLRWSYRRNAVPGHCIVGKPECARCDAPVTGGCRDPDCPLAPRHAELPADRELLRRVHGRPFYTLKDSDVGKSSLRIFGRYVATTNFIGRIMPMDVGKRVYDVGGILQVENEEQRGARLRGV